MAEQVGEVEAAAEVEEREYTVCVSNIFSARSPEDAISQMATWLLDNAYSAGYRVDEPVSGESVFLDADDIDFSTLLEAL